jgi:pyruvate dehydrogenase E2 component (dihydrolipoamide acetyltransferase)
MPEISMPKLSDTMTEGTLVSWKKKKGDKVSAGDVLAEIETDKATMEWESPEDGTLTEIYIAEGGKVNVGDKIAFIGQAGESAPAAAKTEQRAEKEEPVKPAGKKEKKSPAEPKKPATPAKAAERPAGSDEARVKASPVARRLAGELGVDLSSVNGTGPEGRVTESDVRAVASAQGLGAAKAPAQKTAVPAIKPGGGARIRLSGMRKIIADRLVASKWPVPHFYLNIEIDAGPLMVARAELKSAGEGAETSKITVNDFVLKASVQAAVRVPKVNASFDEDSIVQYSDVDLAVAVTIEDGLVTPVLRAAQNKSLREISEVVKDLAHRARHKRMKPEEFQGGSFTVSNLGRYGIDSFSAIINPPQGFILAIGRINKMPVIDDGDQIVPGYRMAICMSCDHRVIDGALGAEYLKELRHLLENPALLLV